MYRGSGVRVYRGLGFIGVYGLGFVLGFGVCLNADYAALLDLGFLGAWLFWGVYLKSKALTTPPLCSGLGAFR